jgi:hypothetical protein
MLTNGQVVSWGDPGSNLAQNANNNSNDGCW